MDVLDGCLCDTAICISTGSTYTTNSANTARGMLHLSYCKSIDIQLVELAPGVQSWQPCSNRTVYRQLSFFFVRSFFSFFFLFFPFQTFFQLCTVRNYKLLECEGIM